MAIQNTENNNESIHQSKRAIKISLCALLVMVIIGMIAIWVILNQIAASVSIKKQLDMLEQRVQKIESLQ